MDKIFEGKHFSCAALQTVSYIEMNDTKFYVTIHYPE